MTEKRLHLLIQGRVQGVYYRQSMKEMADLRHVKGWVRNLPSGEVEAVIEGDGVMVDDLVGWCRRGPDRAAVDRVRIDWEEPKGDFKSFVVKG
ncbi:MAG: acylphosphatase [Candidatus Aquicultor secundus]|uniref:acylphosphatase n=1 Tax=Candidatus Aquicultor secundus TaxID=1973895 RepID=A0A2M7T6K6_9ACTN|nr:acylphosphatase [Candidatus Aquicultor secundus]NCO65611.1 acylphosphatase [Solirubrobacter sp.]OIO86530.1 MAG: acylphosphatase [Candidatus Aquicultor secundus]PIU27059.1 MAG: acylphosphatase [Candidatus Aquicultor secundus]PIW21831.1 MAG: acylphosphatase [Candidatus Aquicultor secundus]PIX52507.1 MAG: acylphosphatase [Candidatus Aquicultor secundus]